MPMIYFQKLTEQGTRSEGTLKNLDEDCKRWYSCHRLQKNTDLCISLFSQNYCIYPWKQLAMSSYVFIKGNLRKYVMYGELLWILLYVCMYVCKIIGHNMYWIDNNSPYMTYLDKFVGSPLVKILLAHSLSTQFNVVNTWWGCRFTWTYRMLERKGRSKQL